jgi:hypothetical protein
MIDDTSGQERVAWPSGSSSERYLQNRGKATTEKGNYRRVAERESERFAERAR